MGNIVDKAVEILGLLAILATAGSAIASVIILAKELKTKISAQIALTKSQEIESQVKLLKAFTEIMDIAHSRKDTVLVESIFANLNIDMDKLGDDEYCNNLKKLIGYAVKSLPVGKASQDAAIASIYSLAKNNPVLLIPAIKGLESISKFVQEDFVKDYLEDLNKTQLG